MRKLINFAFFYAFFAIFSGAFYREFTKFIGYSGRTALSVIHVHLMVLGFVLFLLLALFAKDSELVLEPKFKRFYGLYSIGFPLMIVTLYARGILQVIGGEIPKAVSASISGVAGISHILITIAFIYLFLSFRRIFFNKTGHMQ